MIEADQTKTFHRNLGGLEGVHSKLAKKLIDEIRENPLHDSIVMRAEYQGLRRRAKGRVRILFTYCRDCRERHDEQNRGCPDCDQKPDEFIRLFDVGLRGKLY